MIDLLAQPDCHDIAWGWIQTLFGTNGKCDIINAANVNTPYASAFAVLTAALAFLGALFMAYHTIVGIVHSAYSGKVLGERWHQIWAPLRVVFGFGLMIPIGDGFSSVHYILRDVVGVSAINLANGIIYTYVRTAYSDATGGTTSKVATLAGRDYAQKFFEKEVCSGVIEQMSSSFFTWYSYDAPSPEKADSAWLKKSMMKDGQVWNYGSCGTLTLEHYDPGANSGIFSTEKARALIKEFNKVRAEATESMRLSIRNQKEFMDYAALGKFIDNNSDSIESGDDAIIRKLRENATIPVGIQDKLNKLGDAWDAKIKEKATGIFAELTREMRTSLDDQIKYNGFVAAGSFERSLSAISGTVSGLANATMAGTSPVLDDDAIKKLDFAQGVVMTSKAVDNKGVGGGGADSTSEAVSKAVQALMPTNLENMFTGKASADPVGDMIMFGNNLLSKASYALLFLWGMKAVADGVGNSAAGWFGGGAISSIADSLSKWISWAIMIMILVGLMHSFVLPMLPMIMVLTMSMTWLVMFLEGSIAAILWAFVFIRMDGQEFFDQKQSPGVALLFNLLLRPGLGMLAFCGMLLLLPALLNTLNQVWAGAFYISTGEHLKATTTMGSVANGLGLVWLWQWLASMVIFCWLQWTITLRITNLIPTIADRVGQWMGMQSTSGYGDAAETQGNVAALVAGTQALSRTPIMQGGGGARPPQPGMPGPGGPSGGGATPAPPALNKNGQTKRRR